MVWWCMAFFVCRFAICGDDNSYENANVTDHDSFIDRISEAHSNSSDLIIRCFCCCCCSCCSVCHVHTTPSSDRGRHKTPKNICVSPSQMTHLRISIKFSFRNDCGHFQQWYIQLDKDKYVVIKWLFYIDFGFCWRMRRARGRATETTIIILLFLWKDILYIREELTAESSFKQVDITLVTKNSWLVRSHKHIHTKSTHKHDDNQSEAMIVWHTREMFLWMNNCHLRKSHIS